MRIGITARFQNSYFSGGVPQVACALARSLVQAGHDVTLLYPKGEPSWFFDLPYFESAPRREWTNDQHYDRIVEVVWNLTVEDRAKCATQVVNFVHQPPIFHDMESSCYMWNPTQRSFKNVSVIWTYDLYSQQDIDYLEFLSGVKVERVPYVWDSDPIDAFVKENAIPEWTESAKKVEALLPGDVPKTLSWCARVLESNFSNTSHCVIPLNIVSQIRVRGDPVRFCVHNGDHVYKNEFFKSNIANNLLLPDISGNMVPRVRLPELRKEKSFILAHQRFRPLKTLLLDTLYLGIPMIHNCTLLKSMGAPYYYELNQIQQATEAWKTMVADCEAQTGFFNPKAAAVRQTALRNRFSPASHSAFFDTLVKRAYERKQIELASASKDTRTLRVAFARMWDQFQPKHNFFMYLLAWIGKLNNIEVVHDDANPNLVFFGPMSNGTEAKYPGVPKVFFTGENAPPNKHADTFLNVGFLYDTSPDYVRLPLWVTEINWWGANPDLIVNPRPVALADAMKVDSALLERKDKFCAFVATNPSSPNRNAAFHILNQWRPVDSGGRLFCNLPGGPIPAGLGGGGGEHAKIDFYKQYKFVLAYENSSSPGYTTEKLFHAKIAGCVPIYWGDPFVDRDFDSRGFLNANQVGTPQQLIELVQSVASDDEAWKKMASVPALSEFKKRWCEKTMEEMAKQIFRRVLNREVAVKTEDWTHAQSFGYGYETGVPQQQLQTQPQPQLEQKPLLEAPKLVISEHKTRVFVTATNKKFVESAVNAIASLKTYEPDIPKIVYVWPDVPKEYTAALMHVGATEVRVLPTTVASETPWPDFWEPHHYAWKLWVQKNMLDEAPEGASVLYLDAGTILTASLDKIWNAIETQDVFLLDDADNTNERWSHPKFLELLSVTQDERKGHQITAGLLGYKKGGKYASVAAQALAIAKNHRDAIVGEKWKVYSDVCMGHRHDQSILSVLMQRAHAPRLPLREFYCDVSMRAAKQYATPLYVHRGHYREIVPFADGIDEAYVINLERRADRYDQFKRAHPTIKDRVYRWKATDGRAMALTKDTVHLFRNNDFQWKKSVMGCALSHYGLWKKLAEDKLAKTYLILEDDVRFDGGWMVKWMNMCRDIPADADVVYLGGVLPPNKIALPHITDPVNTHFARVAKNSFYTNGGPPRRYFHFCNYSYLLTKAGAIKLLKLIEERGIFTSGDHMIVNHGDGLLNIYFTTPLLATCFQENDPVYQKSDFNNFSRVDNFDSDLWNNTDRFREEEVYAVLGSAAPEPTPAPPPTPVPSTPAPPPTHETAVQIWNTFLKRVALNDAAHIEDSLNEIFKLWASYSEAEFQKNKNWFSIFEQLLKSNNRVLVPHKSHIEKHVGTMPAWPEWNALRQLLGIQESAQVAAAVAQAQIVFHMPGINPQGIYETEWLNALFPNPIQWKPLHTLNDLFEVQNPLLLMQHIPGRNMAESYILFDVLEKANKQVGVLHLSDEFGKDDLSFYEKKSVKFVLRNYWRPQLGPKVVVLPLGFAKDRGAANNNADVEFKDRPYIWSFAGSADRPGRSEALGRLRAVQPHKEHTKHEWSNPNLLDAQGYKTLLRETKFVPCFTGVSALESYRLYEALEHGAVPIYVPSESTHGANEYSELFGSETPLLAFPSWEKAAEVLPMLAAQTEVMEKHRRNVCAWWTAKKLEYRQKLAQLMG